VRARQAGDIVGATLEAMPRRIARPLQQATAEYLRNPSSKKPPRLGVPAPGGSWVLVLPCGRVIRSRNGTRQPAPRSPAGRSAPRRPYRRRSGRRCSAGRGARASTDPDGGANGSAAEGGFPAARRIPRPYCQPEQAAGAPFISLSHGDVNSARALRRSRSAVWLTV
jgi:hypothetical protein